VRCPSRCAFWRTSRLVVSFSTESGLTSAPSVHKSISVGNIPRNNPDPRRYSGYRAQRCDQICGLRPVQPRLHHVGGRSGCSGEGEFTNLWRTRQFEYSWLRSITSRYVDFSAITEDALLYTASAMHVDLTAMQRQRLLDAYLHLTPWPDTSDALRRLRESDVRVTPTMLRANAERAGLTTFFEALVSTDANHIYKPDRRPRSVRARLRDVRCDEAAAQSPEVAGAGGDDESASFGATEGDGGNRVRINTEGTGQTEKTGSPLRSRRSSLMCLPIGFHFQRCETKLLLARRRPMQEVVHEVYGKGGTCQTTTRR
jgi:2-haloalkanoic acid dehalogenase type II